MAVGLAAIVVVSWLLFGPVDGFHHQYSFGIFGYMFWNGEDPDPNGLLFRGFEVGISPARFVVSLALWAGALYLTVRFIKIAV